MSGPRRRRAPAAFPLLGNPLWGRGATRPSPIQHDGMQAMRSDQQDLDLFRLYLDQIGRHPLLTKEDEIELAQAYEAGLDAQLKLADCADDDPPGPSGCCGGLATGGNVATIVAGPAVTPAIRAP